MSTLQDEYDIKKATDEAVRQASFLEVCSSKWDDDETQSMTTPNDQEKSSKTPSTIPIRFINHSSMGSEKLVHAESGKNILAISDEVGVNIPSQCRSGLCGACTCDIQDPKWTAGYQTVRTCQSSATLPVGCDEMVIDCYRMVQNPATISKSRTKVEKKNKNNSAVNMNRISTNFGDGWEEEFQADYKIKNDGNKIEVIKSDTPDYIVREGQKDIIEIENHDWTPDIGSNIPPWETIW